METASIENPQPSPFSSTDEDHRYESLVPHFVNHGDAEPKRELTEEEVRAILEVIAATGKYWHDWDELKSLLSFQLNLVLGEYPEAKTTSDQQISSSGETFSQISKRLDEAFLSYTEGPPFTLQRLCEILLTARSIYPNFSKLALALEKNLSVTSTLSICTDPYPTPSTQKLNEPDKVSEEPQEHSNTIQNGVETMIADGDEEMVEAEEVEEEIKNTEMETREEPISEASETILEPNINSEPSGESIPTSDQLNTTSLISEASEATVDSSTNSKPSGESTPSSE